MSDLSWLAAGYGVALGSVAVYAINLWRRLERERRR